MNASVQLVLISFDFVYVPINSYTKEKFVFRYMAYIY